MACLSPLERGGRQALKNTNTSLPIIKLQFSWPKPTNHANNLTRKLIVYSNINYFLTMSIASWSSLLTWAVTAVKN